MRGQSLASRIYQSAMARVLFQTQFGIYLFGNTFSLIGTWMQRIAASWLVWDWTGSAFWVGMLAACDLIPVVVIAPFAGVAADRWERKRMNVIAQALSAANTIALTLAFVTGVLGLGSILFFTLFQGILTAATQPSRFAMVQQMVPRQDVGRAVGLNSSCVNIARLVGPSMAGLLILHVGIGWVFAINAAVTLVFTVILSRLRLMAVDQMSKTTAFLAQMAEGFAHVVRTLPLRLIFLAMLFGGGLVRAVAEMMPVVAAQAFEETVTGLAVLTGGSALGAIFAGLTVGKASHARLFVATPMWWALGGMAALVLTYTGHAGLASVAAFALGGAITRGLVITQTFIQLTTPSMLRGRALSVYSLIARGSPALGALAIGYAADRVGLFTAVTMSSGLLFAALLIMALPIWRASRHIGDES